MPGITVCPRKINYGCPFLRRHVGALENRRDLSALDHNILIFDRRPTRAVNDPHVGEDNFVSLHAHEFLHCFRQFRTLAKGSEKQQKQHKNMR